MKRSFLLFSFFLFLALPLVSSAFTFSRTLSLGSSGEDVKDLQIILNADPSTQVTASGLGSKGQESTYFGTLTQAALDKFQQKYAPEVLFPAGIWQPTGIAGTYTRAKLSALSASLSNSASTTFIAPLSLPATLPFSVLPASVAATIPSSTLQSSSTIPVTSQYQQSINFYKVYASGSVPLFLTISKYSAKHGDGVTITGSGFLSTNSIFFGQNYHVDNISSSDGKTLTFTIPPSIPNGAYNVWIVNANGSTYKSGASNFFTVRDTPSDPPTITSISPHTIVYSGDADLVISGTGFTATDNSIYSQFGTVTNVSSNGTTIRISLSSFSGFAAFAKSNPHVSGGSFPLSLTIYNKNGSVTLLSAILIQL